MRQNYRTEVINIHINNAPKLVCAFVISALLGIFSVALFHGVSPLLCSYVCAAELLAALLLIWGNLRKALLLFLALSIPINLHFCLYSRDYAGTLNGIFLTLPDMIIGAVVVLLAIETLWNRSIRIYSYPRTTLPLISLVFVAILTMGVTGDKNHTLYGIVAFIKALLLYLVVANSIRSKNEAIAAFNFLLFGLILAAALLLVQSALHVSFSANGEVRALTEATSLGGNVRASGTLGHPNAAGGYFAGMLMIALSAFGMGGSFLQRLLATCAIFMGASALLLTFTRTGWISFACVFPVLLSLGAKKRVFGVAFVNSALVLVAIGGLLLAGIVGTRMTTDLQTYESRKPLITQAFYIIGQHPLLGIGANTYGDVLHKYRPEDMGNVWLYTVHNGYLYHWVELGTIGFLVFLWLLVSLGTEAWPLLNASDRSTRAMALGAITFLLTEAVFMNGVQWFVFETSGQCFCVLLALMATLRRYTSISQGIPLEIEQLGETVRVLPFPMLGATIN